ACELFLLDRAELRQTDLGRDVVPGDFDAHADCDFFRIDPDHIGVHAHALVQLDDGEHVGHVFSERWMGRLVRDRTSVDPTFPARLDPLQGPDTETLGPRADVARIENPGSTCAAALVSEAMFLRGIPEWPADVGWGRKRLFVFVRGGHLGDSLVFGALGFTNVLPADSTGEKRDPYNAASLASSSADCCEKVPPEPVT